MVEQNKAHDPNNPNHTLDRRREERAAEYVAQENLGRMTEVVEGCMEIWQKNLALGASIYSYWGDALNGWQHAMGHMLKSTERAMQETLRRAG